MKTAKKMLALLLVLTCIVVTTIPAIAFDVQPMSEGTNTVDTSLSISDDGEAQCTVNVGAKLPSQRIEVVMSLYQINRSKPLKSWDTNGTGSVLLSKTYYVAKGHDYQVTADITIKDSNGKLIESFPVSSAIVHY